MICLLKKILKCRCVDKDQMHMTGYSNGGMLAYYLASLEPQTMGMIFFLDYQGIYLALEFMSAKRL